MRKSLSKLLREYRRPDRDAENVADAATEDEEGECATCEGGRKRCEDWEDAGGVEESDANGEGNGSAKESAKGGRAGRETNRGIQAEGGESAVMRYISPGPSVMRTVARKAVRAGGGSDEGEDSLQAMTFWGL